MSLVRHDVSTAFETGLIVSSVIVRPQSARSPSFDIMLAQVSPLVEHSNCNASFVERLFIKHFVIVST